MRVTILGSGSEGNALLLESDTVNIVVDAGLSHRKLVARLAMLGRGAPDISAVIITHSHADHAAHASVYATRWGCPVSATAATLKSLRLRPSVEAHPFIAGRRFRVGDIMVHSRAIPHDAPQVALLFETPLTTIGLVTDLGHVPKGLARFLSGCDTLLLESNHDAEMLRIGPYPASVKRRVASSLGHLSNEQASDLLADLPHTPARVVLMHLSETNNSVRLARSSAEAAIGHQGTQLLVARPREPMELPLVGARQLQLGL
ncbi:MAG: MBL fold metallo-hydrolase [Deltaproteobacteria bacterium]|nr:MBL fold metallo-hydrolase [Deltaproteobacteria bacterium]